VLFVSDLHLAPERPALGAAFEAFCAGPAREARALYVLGDLFDAWIGDDQLQDPFSARVGAALAGVAAAGVPVFVLAGNRDFMLGDEFASAIGARLLPAEIVVDVHGTPTLLLHGDELCTDDVDYQRYRRWTRDPRHRRWLRALPYRLRLALAGWLRRKSRQATAAKPESIMDVSAAAVERAFLRHGVARMIHGHTHRPARHHLTVAGRPCERLVLADWYDHGSVLEVTPAGIAARTLPPA
jgi:UDP-2,3-diacylglucosamine hydrolase